jgi:hypothetical protein
MTYNAVWTVWRWRNLQSNIFGCVDGNKSLLANVIIIIHNRMLQSKAGITTQDPQAECGPRHLHVFTCPLLRISSFQRQIMADAPGPTIRHHGFCFILWFQSIQFCWGVSSSSGMTVVCTAIRWLTPLSALVRQQSRPSKECVTDRNNRQILLSQMWHLVLRGEFAYKLSNRNEVLCVDTKVWSFLRQNTCETDILSKFEF